MTTLDTGRSIPSSPVGDGQARADQNHLAIGVGQAERQHLGHEFSDLPGRKVDHGQHLPAEQILRAVVARDLGRGFLDAEPGPEIDPELERRLFRLGKGLGLDDRADADVDAQKIVEADATGQRFVHGAQIDGVGSSAGSLRRSWPVIRQAVR
jgi:hypothetical protein